MMRRPAALAVLALLAGCAATPQGGGCGARDLVLRNASAQAVEQAYAGSGAAAGWGGELLGANLPPGGERKLRLPAGTKALRLVWANGRAAEITDVDLCAIGMLTLDNEAIRADR